LDQRWRNKPGPVKRSLSQVAARFFLGAKLEGPIGILNGESLGALKTAQHQGYPKSGSRPMGARA